MRREKKRHIQPVKRQLCITKLVYKRSIFSRTMSSVGSSEAQAVTGILMTHHHMMKPLTATPLNHLCRLQEKPI